MVYKNETITVNTLIGFTTANLSLAGSLHGRPVKQITCTLETAEIRVWEKGTPTDSVGHIISIGDVFIVKGEDAIGFQAIKTGATNGMISVSYEV